MNTSHLLLLLWVFTFPAHQVTRPDDTLFTRTLADHVVDGKVDYAAIREDKRFGRYLAEVADADPGSLSTRSDSLAFWINAYNAFTIKLVTDHYPVKSIRDITQDGRTAWDIPWIRIHGSTYSLNDIEHHLIRKYFHEPLIHMALVCAAKGCPPLRSEAYVGATLDEQLHDNAARFFADTSKNRYDGSTNTLYLSRIFDWYGGDFAGRYGSPEEFALTMLGVPDAKPAKVLYLNYDWSLNKQ